ncbi:MAG: hypothetical protein DMF57_06780 [Acidobacteria bacterium]|nr:MAG: hypothetical protein DMF57_06780 [Acidobacteriota bacterium]
MNKMDLKPIDGSELLEQVAGWLSRKENCQWLDFGDGQKVLTPQWLKVMAHSNRHELRVFTSDSGEPVGVVALSNIDRASRTATLWAALGDKRYTRNGYSTRALAEMLRFGFRELGLHAINTWIVEHNQSLKIALRLKFRQVGRQRECHWIDGRPYDRLILDVLASEFSEDEIQHE